MAAPPALLPPFPAPRFSGCVTLDGAEPPLNLRPPPRRTHEKDAGMPLGHPGPEGRGYQRPRPMNRPDPPAVSANGPKGREQGPGTRDRERQRPKRREPATGNRELAIGSDEQYQKSPSWPGTATSCRLFLRPVGRRCAKSCYRVLRRPNSYGAFAGSEECAGCLVGGAVGVIEGSAPLDWITGGTWIFTMGAG